MKTLFLMSILMAVAAFVSPRLHPDGTTAESIATPFAPHVIDVLLAAPFTGECSQDCTDCTMAKHSAKANVDGEHRRASWHSSSNHECESVAGHGICEDNHPQDCGPDFGGLNDLVNGLTFMDVHELTSIAEQFPEIVRLNHHRSA